MRVVVTGASRGLGFEFVRQFLERGAHVDALVRTSMPQLQALLEAEPTRLRVHPVDVTDLDALRGVAARIEAPVDLLINNAGVGGKYRAIEELDFQELQRTFDVNALGPLRVSSVLLPLIRKSSIRKIVHVSSLMGSIGDNTSGGYYGYRMSKAALNMASSCLARDLSGEQIISVVVNPGWVQTDMGGPRAPMRPEESVSAMIKVIDGLELGDSGRFLDYRGKELPW